MDEPRAHGQAALGVILGLASVIELASRLTAGTTQRAGAAGGPVSHIGVSAQSALLMFTLCLLATVPAVLPRPVTAAATVSAATVLSLVLFELVTAAAAAALLIVAYRLARSAPGAAERFGAVAMAAPFLVIAVALVAPPSSAPAPASGLAGAGGDTRVLTVLLASAIPVAALAGMTRRAGEESRIVVAVRELTGQQRAEHLARGERARIARELHDVVAHHISMIAVQAETARLTTPGLTESGAQRFAAIGDTARAGLTEMRRLLGVLREDAAGDPLDGAEAEAAPWPVADRQPQPGLPQLGGLVDEARKASGSTARLIVSGLVTRLDPGVELAAYRIVQEALTNARRHAPGAAVDVELSYADDALRLRVRDNGPGPAAEAGDRNTGHGLLGMRERAAAAGGSLRTGEAAGGGFCVEARLPAKAHVLMNGAGDAP